MGEKYFFFIFILFEISVLQYEHLTDGFIFSHSEHVHIWLQSVNKILGSFSKHITHLSILKDSSSGLGGIGWSLYSFSLSTSSDS